MIALPASAVASAAVLAAAPAMADFGAIAYSRATGSYGYAFNHPDRGGAEDRAFAECALYANDCVVANWFQNACGALAAGRGNGWGAEWSDTLREAEAKALAQCRSFGNSGCEVTVSLCSEQ